MCVCVWVGCCGCFLFFVFFVFFCTIIFQIPSCTFSPASTSPNFRRRKGSTTKRPPYRIDTPARKGVREMQLFVLLCLFVCSFLFLSFFFFVCLFVFCFVFCFC